jgi:asparagine synthase (glutamine-hydrolysing)
VWQRGAAKGEAFAAVDALMAGIAGVVAAGLPAEHTESLRLMLSCMKHQRHDAVGSHLEQEMGLYLGWVSAPGSASSPQAVWNAPRTVGMVLHGDCLSLGGTRQAAAEHRQDDVKRLLQVYEERGSDFVEALPAWCSGVLVDLSSRRVVLFNDRFGFQRIYYHEGPDCFLFASEAKSLLRIRSELRRIEATSLAEYFAVGCPLEGRSLFAGISLLPGASYWIFEGSERPKKTFYFSPKQWEEQPRLDADTFQRRFGEAVAAIVPRYFNPTGEVGLSLTGGIDTRLLLASRPLEPGTVACYTFTGPSEDTLDVILARRLAAFMGQEHHVLSLERDFFTDFPDLAARTVYLTDGAFDVCGTHEIYLNKMAASIAPVRLTGNYGSEVLRGATTFKPLSLVSDVFEPDFRQQIAEAERRFYSARASRRLSFTLFQDLPWNHYGCFAAAQSQVTVRTPYLDPRIVGLAYQAPAELSESAGAQLSFIADNRAALLTIPTDREAGARLPRPLRFVQRLMSAAGFKLDYYAAEGLPGVLGHVDPLLARVDALRIFPGPHRYLRYSRWFRRELSGFIRDMLADKGVGERPYINRPALERLAVSHLEGQRNHTQEINRILTLELIHRGLLVDADPSADQSSPLRPNVMVHQ